jgi:methionine-rich copper-binding protein CopC
MRKILISFVIGVIALLSMPSSSAHVEIVSSFPERFANVNPIPTQVWIQFSGNLQTLEGEAVNSLEVIDSTGIAVNFEDPIIDGAKIMTKISGQSAPGAFTVKYRVVGDDGHVIEGDYSFNASPDYAEAVPTTTSADEESSTLNVGGVVLVFFLIVFAVGYIIKERNDKKK